MSDTPEVIMHFPKPRTAGAIILFAIWMPVFAWSAVAHVASDPQRWFKPDVYLLLCATIYAAGSITSYALSPIFRRSIEKLSPWLAVALNPIAVLVLCFSWASHHDPLLIGIIIAVPGGLAWWTAKRRVGTPL